MNRLEFLGGVAAAAGARYVRGRSIPQDDIEDPANEAQSQALRVLLGRGQAQKVDDQTFLFEGRRYRGAFNALPSGEIVNTVGVEQYLYGVVSREMPPSWPPSALQAQAIVARTYVLQRSNPNRDYDLVPSEIDQVYTGVDAEHAQSNAAVDATAGQVVRFGEGFAQVLYSSCCGGHTESNGDAWGGTQLPYLAGVQCGHCTDSPWYSWTQHVPLEQMQSALAAQLQAIGTIQQLSLDTPDGSGRPRFWNFTGENGTQRVKAADVRRALGTRVLPSLLVHRVSVQANERADIEGGGLGHGVGLCQWGARGMARDGAGVRTILAYYYPGTGIGND